MSFNWEQIYLEYSLQSEKKLATLCTIKKEVLHLVNSSNFESNLYHFEFAASTQVIKMARKEL